MELLLGLSVTHNQYWLRAWCMLRFSCGHCARVAWSVDEDQLMAGVWLR